MMGFEVGVARRHLDRVSAVELAGVEPSARAAEDGAALWLSQEFGLQARVG